MDASPDAGHDAIAGNGSCPRPPVRVQKRPNLPHRYRTDFAHLFLPHSYRTALRPPHKTAQEKLLKSARRCELILVNKCFLCFSTRKQPHNLASMNDTENTPNLGSGPLARTTFVSKSNPAAWIYISTSVPEARRKDPRGRRATGSHSSPAKVVSLKAVSLVSFHARPA